MCRVISPQPSAGVSCIYLLVTTKRRCDMSPSSSLPTESQLSRYFPSCAAMPTHGFSLARTYGRVGL